jgi:tripartite-type tricarboxylate transporter receptor subunit TctC
MGERDQDRERQAAVKAWLIRSALAASLLAVAGSACAQAWPSRPLRMTVGASAGGTTDIVARIVAAKLGERLGQQVVVENRAGAGGNLALDVVAKAPADGYTVAMAYSGLSINPVVMSSMPFDTLKDLAPVSLVATVQMFLIVDPGLKIGTVGQLVEQAKANPGRLAIAANALASVSHLAAELFKVRAGVDMPTLVYKGSSPALVDMLGGRVAAMFDTVPGALPHVKSGKVRAIAIGSRARSSLMLDVPTLAESGFPDIEIRSWYGVLATGGTPLAIIERLNAEISAIVRLPEIRERFAAQSLDPVGGTPAEFGAFIRDEMIRWAGVARTAGIKLD